jgi:hypothetical protein
MGTNKRNNSARNSQSFKERLCLPRYCKYLDLGSSLGTFETEATTNKQGGQRYAAAWML